MGAELRHLSKTHGFDYKLCLEKGGTGDFEGYLTAEVLKQWFPHDPNTAVYFCGPRPFMHAVNRLLQDVGIAPERLHYEVFGPTTSLSS